MNCFSFVNENSEDTKEEVFSVLEVFQELAPDTDSQYRMKNLFRLGRITLIHVAFHSVSDLNFQQKNSHLDNNL